MFSPPPRSPRSVSPPPQPPMSPPTPRSKKAEPEPQTSGNEMADLLKQKKGLVVISDILGLCAKPKKSRFIGVPGDEDKRFRGYNTANELLESLQVDTKKVR